MVPLINFLLIEEQTFTSSYHPNIMVMLNVSIDIMQIIAKHVASAHKDWDTYLPSAMNAYNTSLSETTDDTSFFLTYCCKPVKILDVALLPPMVAKMSRLSPRTINLTNEDSKTIGY